METPYFSGCEQFPSLWALFVNLVFALLGQLCVLYTNLFTCLFLFSILHFRVGFDIPYSTYNQAPNLVAKRIVRIISKKGFDAHTNPLFKSLMILKLEDIYSLHSWEIYVFF